MRYVILFLLAGYGFELQARALQAIPPESEGESEDMSGLSARLDEFVLEAIDEGLLEPVDDVEQVAPEPIDESPHSLQPEQAITDHIPTCEETYALDFEELEYLGSYQDIYSLREARELPEGSSQIQNDQILIKAYIALGLNAEALQMLSGEEDAQSIVLRHLTILMENRQQPDIAYFEHLTGCHSEAGIWLAVAQLASGHLGGAQGLEAHLSNFRQLPLELRIGVAVIIIPELDRYNEQFLAEKVMTFFADEEVQASSELRFMQALLELGEENSAAEETVSAFLTEPQFQEAALSAMMREARPVDQIKMDILLDQLVNKISLAENEFQIVKSLDLALTELGEYARYNEMLQLAELPILQRAFLQDEIKETFTRALLRDLETGDALRNLMAIDAMMKGSDLLAEEPERDSLYVAASILAESFGSQALAEQLSEHIENAEIAAERRAELAYRRADFETVYALARKDEGREPITLLAAKSAIREGNRDLLRSFEARLEFDPETILSLIEADAETGDWIVSRSFYLAAEIFSDEEHATRAQRILALREARRYVRRSPASQSITGVPKILARAQVLLNAPSEEAS